MACIIEKSDGFFTAQIGPNIGGKLRQMCRRNFCDHFLSFLFLGHGLIPNRDHTIGRGVNIGP